MSRLDKELVERKLAETRTQAQLLIEQGKVKVNNKIQTKASLSVNSADQIEIEQNDLFKYVSRGGFKLEKALNIFNVSVKNKVVMDIGSSTGGFTDCCLQNGAKKAICVDVGTDVLHPKLRQDKRIELHENTNIKNIPLTLFKDVEVVVVDVSFISLERIVEKVNEANIKLDMICLIKPQFECGKEIVTKYGGVIKSKTVHKEVLEKVIQFFKKNGFDCLGLDFSPIKGGDGNLEFIAHFNNYCNICGNVNIEKVISCANNFKFGK